MILEGLRELLGVVVALAAVSLLAWAAIWIMKRMQVGAAGASGASGASGDLRFVRALPVGPRERLVVVEWRGETLLIGVTAGNVSLLSREAGVSLPPAPSPSAGIGADPS